MSMWPVTERSVDKADCHRCSEMAAKSIKLQEETISEILFADTDSKSGTEASDFEDFEEEEEKQQQKASAEVGGQAAASGGLPTWGPPQGRNTNIHPFVSPAKGVKKSDAPHIKKRQLATVCVAVVFCRNFSSPSGEKFD